MPAVVYNDNDSFAAGWLENLVLSGAITPGYIDRRSITEIEAQELESARQVHFFAGIGGWSHALRLAGYEKLKCWTGSPPCQPFSVAGKQKGKDDERHLAPTWLRLIGECRPPIIFGEQVADAIRHGWLDDLFNALEGYGYACGAAVLPACSVGAPHIRKRLFFGAARVAHPADSGRERQQDQQPPGILRQVSGAAGGGQQSSPRGAGVHGVAFPGPGRRPSQWQPEGGPPENSGGAEQAVGITRLCEAGRLADATCEQHYGGWDLRPGRGPEHTDSRTANRLADTDHTGPQRRQLLRERAYEQPVGARGVAGGPAVADHRFWDGADWLGCRDGKFRPVEPGTQPLAYGVPARVGRLRGYGNAIVPQVASIFIQSFMQAIPDAHTYQA